MANYGSNSAEYSAWKRPDLVRQLEVKITVSKKTAILFGCSVGAGIFRCVPFPASVAL